MSKPLLHGHQLQQTLRNFSCMAEPNDKPEIPHSIRQLVLGNFSSGACDCTNVVPYGLRVQFFERYHPIGHREHDLVEVSEIGT